MNTAIRTNLIGNEWDTILAPAFASDSYAALRKFLISEYSTTRVYPAMGDIFNALKYTPPDKVKVVLLGQDPYINEGQAHGLAFSVKPGCVPPPSLMNIYKQLQSDAGVPIASSGHLVPWAEQGVLLLNTVLTTRSGLSNSHKGKGWELFTDEVIKYLGSRDDVTVFLLWGRNAQSKEPLIANPRHLILKAPHPSPLSASYGFFGCRHFSKTTEYLQRNNIPEINWNVAG